MPTLTPVDSSIELLRAFTRLSISIGYLRGLMYAGVSDPNLERVYTDLCRQHRELFESIAALVTSEPPPPPAG
ncbi:MAG TPA: hypothetical protein V6C65_40280 [Allocoleopsis sp.]